MSSPVELVRALAALAEPPAAEHQRISRILELPDAPDAAMHTDLFAHEVYPYASVYLGAEGMLGGDAKGRIVGFWRALGVDAPEDADHLTSLLSLWASLRSQSEVEPDEARARLERQASDALFFEHLLPWVFVFLEAVRGIEAGAGREGGFYHRWAVTLAAISTEISPSEKGLPVHLRESAGLPDPTDVGGEGFLDAVLAPVRSGVVLSRSDLRRMTRELGLGGRIAERRYALRAYISQSPAAVFEWLADEADAWTARHRNPNPTVQAFWVGRARESATALRDAADQARRWVES